METGIVIKPAVWIYKEDKKEAADEIFMGWAVGILEECEGWMHIVTHYGYRGWLRQGTVCRLNPEELCRRDEMKQTLFVSRAFADVLDRPDVRGQILCTLSRGAFLTGACGIKDGYQRVRLPDGREGYVPALSCKRRKDSDGYLYSGEPEGYFLRKPEDRNFSEETLRDKIIFCAKSYLGTQYRWAGKSAEGIDCSGLAFMSHLMNGIIIYRDAKLQDGFPVKKISMEQQIKPGDLLYFPGHVALYLGDMKYIHATGHENNFGCAVNSLSKKDWNYRKDLAESLLMAGSVF